MQAQFKVKWKKLVLYIFITLTSEILFTFLGIDDLVDYGEFIFQKSSLPAILILKKRTTKFSC